MYTNDTDITKHLSTANTDTSQILKGLRLSDPKNDRNIIDSIVLKFHDHPSFKMIKNKFSFHQVKLVDVRKSIKDIKLGKSSSGDIPADILRRCDLCFQALTNYIDQSIVSGKFPDFLKLIYKAKDPLDKTNYRPVSVLALLSEIYERLIFDQLSRHTNNILSKLLNGFRKAYSTKHALFRLLQSW